MNQPPSQTELPNTASGNGEQVRLAKEGILFTFLTAFGKLTGFLREWLVAFFFGAGIVSDAYRVSVDFLRSLTLLLAGSTTQAAFVPLLTRWRIRGILRNRAILFRSIAWLSTLVGISLTLFLMIAGNWIAKLQAPDYSPEELKTISMMLRWIAPSVPIFVAESMLSCLLMSNKQYRLLGYTSVVMNLLQIVAILLIGLDLIPLVCLPISYWISQIFVVLMLFIDARKWWIHEKVRYTIQRVKLVTGRFMYILAPLMIIGIANQLRLFMDRRFSSEYEAGAIAALYFARFITETPQWTIGRTLNSMLLPHFSELAESGDNASFRRHFLILLDTSLWGLIPLIVLLAGSAEPIIRLLYGYGAFDQRAVLLSSSALIGASVSIWTAVFQPIINRVLISQERSKVLLPYGLVQAALNIGLAWYLGNHYGIFGIAISLGITQFVTILALLPTLHLHLTATAIARISLWFAWGVGLLLLIKYLPLPDGGIVHILSVIGIVLPAWAAASFLFPHGKENMKRLGSIVSRMRKS